MTKKLRKNEVWKNRIKNSETSPKNELIFSTSSLLLLDDTRIAIYTENTLNLKFIEIQRSICFRISIYNINLQTNCR